MFLFFSGILNILGVTANIAGPRGTIRAAQTPPSVTNISTSFVRGVPPRTPSPAGTVIPTATTWMTGSQPVQLIRANIGQSPRAKCKFHIFLFSTDDSFEELVFP